MVLALLCAASVGRAAEEKAASPEVAVRRLLTAMTFGDEEGVRRHALPHEKLAVLTAGPVAEKDRAAATAALDRLQMRQLAAGERVVLPGGLVVTGRRTSESDPVIVIVTDMPLPFVVVQAKGEWRVDAATIIEARLAGERAAKGKK